MDEDIVDLIVPGMICLGLGAAYVYAEVEHFRYRDEKYRPLIWHGATALVRGVHNSISNTLFSGKRKIHRLRYPIKTDSEGYILQKDVPLLEENDHTRERNNNDFLVAGRNESNVIGNLDELVGFSVDQLEHRMYPDEQSHDEISESRYLGSNPAFGGFLKEREKLIPRLVADNDYVLSQGLTHQDVAKPLLYVYNLMERTGKLQLKFSYDGVKYQTEGNFWPMGQMSPFSNELVFPAGDITLTREDGETLRFSTVHPFMINGFGFYEGDVQYRIEPQNIIEFFEITSTGGTPSS